MQSRSLENEHPGWVGKRRLSKENPKKEQNLLRIPPSLGCFFRKWVAYNGQWQEHIQWYRPSRGADSFFSRPQKHPGGGELCV